MFDLVDMLDLVDLLEPEVRTDAPPLDDNADKGCNSKGVAGDAAGATVATACLDSVPPKDLEFLMIEKNDLVVDVVVWTDSSFSLRSISLLGTDGICIAN
jgi:hypothetical protein